MNLIQRKCVALIHRIQRHYTKWEDRFQTDELCRQFSKCGEGIYIYAPCRITAPHKVKVGNNVHINRGAFIRANGGLLIGDNVHIGRNLVLYTVNHNYQGEALPYDHTNILKPVVINKNVWIGINVTIIPGITIGEGAIIGAGTVVSKDVPPLAIVGASPQQILKYRDKEHYRNLEQRQCYGGPSGVIFRRES